MTMRALTLWQPWAWAVAAGFKTLENRPWPPPTFLLGETFALHASVKWDEVGAGAVRQVLGSGALERARAQDVRGAIIGVATLARVVHVDALLPSERPSSLAPEDARWFFGPYGWVLSGVRRLSRPIPCRGYQKLWSLPEGMAAEVTGQLAELELVAQAAMP